ncbi:MAG: glycosyltransferase family 39 protein, partial [Patescibacteria group bacterium]
MKNKIFWIILGITLAGAILRMYHFEDWMHYQLDQARDFRVVHAAIEYGPGELPLQGPRAAGSFLRLGPLLYYLEYGSALVFGDTPAGSVTIILILNILAIPLFYLFARRFFDWRLSAGLSSIFAVSLYMIVYSRFGWNPTLVPFFMMLFAYSILKIDYRDNKYSGWWLSVAAFALVFIMNMHFVAFVTVPVIAFIYLIWTKPHTKFIHWVFAVLVFVFLNIPLIVNDVKTGGENLVAFFDVVLDRGGDEEDNHNIVDKIVK